MKSTDHVGKGILVVYFYPADMTGGCTKAQTCGFRDDANALKEKVSKSSSVSSNSTAEHQMFIKEKGLNFARCPIRPEGNSPRAVRRADVGRRLVPEPPSPRKNRFRFPS